METTGLNHVILTISNVERSRAFYGDLLGFDVKDMANGFFFMCGGVYFFFFLSGHPIRNDRFDEFRIGLDHLSFTAPDEDSLHSLAATLKAASLETNGVEVYHTGDKYVAFRDPDNIQLEYWLPRQASA